MSAKTPTKMCSQNPPSLWLILLRPGQTFFWAKGINSRLQGNKFVQFVTLKARTTQVASRFKVVGRTGKVSEIEKDIGLGRGRRAVNSQGRHSRPSAERPRPNNETRGTKETDLDPYGYVQEAEQLSARSESGEINRNNAEITEGNVYKQSSNSSAQRGKLNTENKANTEAGLDDQCNRENNPKNWNTSKPTADALDEMLLGSEVDFQDFLPQKKEKSNPQDTWQGVDLDTDGKNKSKLDQKKISTHGNTYYSGSSSKEYFVQRANSDFTGVNPEFRGYQQSHGAIRPGQQRNSVHFADDLDDRYHPAAAGTRGHLGSVPISSSASSSYEPMMNHPAINPSMSPATPPLQPSYPYNLPGNNHSFHHPAQFSHYPVPPHGIRQQQQQQQQAYAVAMQPNIHPNDNLERGSEPERLKSHVERRNYRTKKKRTDKGPASSESSSMLPSLNSHQRGHHSRKNVYDSKFIRSRSVDSRNARHPPSGYSTKGENRARSKFKPYTMDDYRLQQSNARNQKLGGLGANTGTDEWQKKKEKRERMLLAAAKTRENNLRRMRSQTKQGISSQPRKLTAREKAKIYAASVPKPPRSKSVGVLNKKSRPYSGRRKLGSARMRKKKNSPRIPPMHSNTLAKNTPVKSCDSKSCASENQDDEATQAHKFTRPKHTALVQDNVSLRSNEFESAKSDNEDSLTEKQNKNMAQRDAVAEIRRQLAAMQ
eukprot:jgi/Bigna1/68485/fgenesh1_pg.6_\